MLFNYCITPHSTTGTSPLKLLMGRKLKSLFDLLKPNIATRVVQKQQEQKDSHDSHAIGRQFQEGVRQGQSLLTGTIMKCLGPVSFEVETSEGQRIRCHQDHLRKRSQTLIWLDSSVANDSPSNNPGPS